MFTLQAFGVGKTLTLEGAKTAVLLLATGSDKMPKIKDYYNFFKYSVFA